MLQFVNKQSLQIRLHTQSEGGIPRLRLPSGARGPATCVSSLELVMPVTHLPPHTWKVPPQCPTSLPQTTAMWRSPILLPCTLISFESSLLSTQIILNCCCTTILTPNSFPQSVAA